VSENLALYSAEYSTLPPEQMLSLVERIKPRVEHDSANVIYVYEWPDLTIRCTEMGGPEVPAHLVGFSGYVTRIFRGVPEARALQIVDRIKLTQLVVGVEIIPNRDPEERADELVGKLCSGLQAMMFFEGALYEYDGKLLLGPDGSSSS
jgi:hypothetical protein